MCVMGSRKVVDIDGNIFGATVYVMFYTYLLKHCTLGSLETLLMPF